MTVFTVKDWKNATNHEGGGDTSTPISAESLEDLETRVTSGGGRTITSANATDQPLVLKAAAAQTADIFSVTSSTGTAYLSVDDSGSVYMNTDLQGGYANLTLGNITSGQNPANCPQLYYEKDSVLRWSIGIDVQAGDQGDLAFWHSNAYSGGNSGDFVYITDEDNPGFSIGHGVVDRTLATGAQFTVSNPSAAQRPAAIIIQNWPGNQPTLKLYRDSSLQTAPFVECRDYDIDDLKFEIRTDGVLGWADGTNLYEQSANTLMTDGNLIIDEQLTAGGAAASFFAGTAVVGFWDAAGQFSKPEITGSAGGNAALQDLLTTLEGYGLITDSST